MCVYAENSNTLSLNWFYNSSHVVKARSAKILCSEILLYERRFTCTVFVSIPQTKHYMQTFVSTWWSRKATTAHLVSKNDSLNDHFLDPLTYAKVNNLVFQPLKRIKGLMCVPSFCGPVVHASISVAITRLFTLPSP